MAELILEKREILGKKVALLRASGVLPGELYGHGIDNIHVSVSKDDFEKVYGEAGEHAIVNVLISGDSRSVLIYDVHKNNISGEILSVDFYQVKMDEKVTTNVPLEFVGESPAVENLGGILTKTMDEIEVEALPADIPQRITVDLSALTEFDQTIYVKDLSHSEKYEFSAEEDMPVASVSAPREEEEEESEELTPEDVVVEGEEKRATDEPDDESSDAKNNEKA